MKRYAFFDLDNTVYDGYSINSFIPFLVYCNYIPKIYERRLHTIIREYENNQINYESACAQTTLLVAQAISGKSVSEVDGWGREFRSCEDHIFSWVPSLFQFLDRNEFSIYLISATPLPVIRAVTQGIGYHKIFGSPIEIVDDVYTGKIEYMLNYERKSELIHRIVGHISDESLTIAFGDSTGDVPMLESVNLAYVIHVHQEELERMCNSKQWYKVTDETILDVVQQKIYSYETNLSQLATNQ